MRFLHWFILVLITLDTLTVTQVDGRRSENLGLLRRNEHRIKAEVEKISIKSENKVTAVVEAEMKGADPIFLAVTKSITLVSNLINIGITHKRISDFRATITRVDDELQKVWRRRTENCVSLRSLEFEARLLGILTKVMVKSASEQFASNLAVVKVRESATKDEKNTFYLLDQKAIKVAEAFAAKNVSLSFLRSCLYLYFLLA